VGDVRETQPVQASFERLEDLDLKLTGSFYVFYVRYQLFFLFFLILYRSIDRFFSDPIWILVNLFFIHEFPIISD